MDKIIKAAWAFIALFLLHLPHEAFSNEQHKPLGIDVSSYRSLVDWEEVKKGGVDFVIVRTTIGENGIDEYFQKSWTEAGESGLIRGACHLFNARENASDQAKHFLKTISLEDGDLPPIIDVARTKENREVSQEVFVKKLKTILTLVEKKTRLRPIIYTGVEMWNDFLSEEFSNYPLWVTDDNPEEPETIKNRNNWAFRQHKTKGVMPGVNGFVDEIVFEGSEEDFDALIQYEGDDHSMAFLQYD